MSEGSKRAKGPIEWMAHNSVASNLLMMLLMVGGFLMASRVKQEVFPEVDLGAVVITVPYPGANPSEVEQGIILAAEEAVQGLDGVKKVSSSAREGVGSVTVELLDRVNEDRVLADIKNAVDRITSFPVDAEAPTVSMATNRSQVISVIIFGDLPEETLRQLAEEARRDLLAKKEIVLVDMSGVRPREIAIEVSQENLSAYGLTLSQIATTVRLSSVELSGGSVRTSGGEILIRTDERRDLKEEFAEITVLATPAGTALRLRDIATITDGFKETDQEATYNGIAAIKVDIFRVGSQSPTEVAAAAFAYVEEARRSAAPGVEYAIWDDRAEFLSDRIDLLVRNGILGLILVFIILGIFLDIQLAFWVLLGIPISFLGAFIFMPMAGVSINMISLFAFIVGLGIVVDDAIVIGENVYHNRQSGMSRLDAASHGAKRMAMPVVFAVLTTIAAFSPLLFVPGFMGKLFRVIPLVVIPVLLLSLVESLFILPAHLAHSSPGKSGGVFGLIRTQQQKVSVALQNFIDRMYDPAVRWAVNNRYITISIGISLLLMSLGMIAGGRVPFTFMPKIEADLVTVSARLPYGASLSEAQVLRDRITDAARRITKEIAREAGSDTPQVRGIYSQIGEPISTDFAGHGAAGSSGAHIVDAAVFLVPSDQRDISASAFADRWRRQVGNPAGLRTIAFNFSTGPSGGAAVDLQLIHPKSDVLEQAASELAEAITVYAGVKDVDAGFANGKTQYDFKLTSAARALGLTEASMARQLRDAFFGAEALRQQRGRDEVKVIVRLPKRDRASPFGLERYRLRTPSGAELPLSQAAHITTGKSYTTIRRVNGQRVLNVTSDIDEAVANANQVIARIEAEIMPDLIDSYPGLTYRLEGSQKEQQESLSALMVGFLMAQFVIYALLAVPFKSYMQPFIVMSAIPFGLIGAVAGHLMLGYNISVISMMGLVALTGVVVNDSLVLIVAANELRDGGATPFEAVIQGGIRRFRPIMLTSLTTFFGLMPMIFEASVQARFLIPMAISLSFGVLAATGITLALVPSLYMVVEDVLGLIDRILGKTEDRSAEESTAATQVAG